MEDVENLMGIPEWRDSEMVEATVQQVDKMLAYKFLCEVTMGEADRADKAMKTLDCT